MAIGFVADAWDWAVDKVEDVGDVAIDVLEEVPMAPELADALTSVVNGPLRDFARTDLGMTVFRAMATTIYGPLAWTIGPQVAALAFAVPGVARGEDFWTAWLKELSWRAEKTAETIAPMASGALTPKIREVSQKLVAMIPYENLRGMATDELARRLNVDEWTAAMAASLVGLIPIPSAADFDPISGRRIAINGAPLSSGPTLGKRRRVDAGPLTPECARYQALVAAGDLAGAVAAAPACNASKPSTSSKSPCQLAEDAYAKGQSIAIVSALRRKCYAAQDAGEVDEYGYVIPPSMRANATTITAATSSEGSGGSGVALAAVGAVALGAFLVYRLR